MSELLSVLITAGVFILVMFIKPEWLIGWLLNLLVKRLPRKNANDVTNALGIKLIEAGIVAIEQIEDEGIKTEVDKLKEQVARIKKALFPFS